MVLLRSFSNCSCRPPAPMWFKYDDWEELQVYSHFFQSSFFFTFFHCATGVVCVFVVYLVCLATSPIQRMGKKKYAVFSTVHCGHLSKTTDTSLNSFIITKTALGWQCNTAGIPVTADNRIIRTWYISLVQITSMPQ